MSGVFGVALSLPAYLDLLSQSFKAAIYSAGIQMTIGPAGKAFTIYNTEKDARRILNSNIKKNLGKKMRRVSAAIHDLAFATQEAGVSEALDGADDQLDVGDDLQLLYESTIKAIKYMLASRDADELDAEKVLLLAGP